MLRLLAKFWFFIAVAMMVVLAFIVPQLGPVCTRYHVLDIAIFTSFLITGLMLQTRAIGRELRRIVPVTMSAISCFVFFPAMAFALAKLVWPNDPALVIGVAIVAVAPATIASGIILTQVAHGNVPLGIFICIATNTLAIFTIPVSLSFLLHSQNDIQLPVAKMIRDLLVLILLPTVIGQIVRIPIRDTLPKYKKVFSIFSQIVVLMILFNAVANATDNLLQLGGRLISVVAFVFLLHGLAMLMNYGLSRLLRFDRPSTTAFTILASQKTITVSFIVASRYFSAWPLAVIPAIVYHVSQLTIDMLVAHRLRVLAERADPTLAATAGSLPPSSPTNQR